MNNIYTKINEGLDFDCIEILHAKSDTVSQFVRFYNTENDEPEDKIFMSHYEKAIRCPGNTKRQIALHRGVSINNIEGDESRVVEISKDIISQIPRKIRNKWNWNAICVFKIVSEEELVACTQGKSNTHHRTLIKSDNFSVANCLNIIKMLSII